MKTAYALAVEAEMKSGDVNAIAGGLKAFNAAQTGGATPTYVVISLRENRAGELVGGLVAGAYLGWLSIQAIWPPEEVRGQGYGKRLMALAEAEAVRLQCPRVFLETYSFQALGFYEKLGYVVAGKIPDFPPGGARYALTKQLVSSENESPSCR